MSHAISYMLFTTSPSSFFHHNTYKHSVYQNSSVYIYMTINFLCEMCIDIVRMSFYFSNLESSCLTWHQLHHIHTGEHFHLKLHV
jgi:hypothetical protein